MKTHTLQHDKPERTFGPRVYHLLFAQSLFGLGWSFFLILPKFYATALGAEAETIGQLASMNGVANIVGLPVALWLVKLGSRKPLFFLGCAALCVVSLGLMAIDHVSPILYVLQGLVGFAFVCTFNGSATLVTDEVPPSHFGQALGLVGASNMIMNAVSTSIGEAVSLAYGWKMVFGLALVCSVLAMVVAALFKEGTRAVPKPESPEADEGRLADLLAPLFGAMMVGTTFVAMFVFYQPYALSLGAEHVRTFFIGFTITAVGVRVFLGNLGDRAGRMRVSTAAMALYAVSSFSMVWLRIDLLLLYGMLLGVAHGILYPTLNAAAVERVPPAGRGRAMTLFTGAFAVGVGVSAQLFGRLAQGQGYPAVFVAGTVACLLGVIALGSSYWLRERRGAAP